MTLQAPTDVPGNDSSGFSLRLVRAAAPGRMRLAVSGLRHQPAVKQRVTDVLAALPGVRTVEASALTGNVLVLFDTARWTAPDLLEAAGRALGGEAEPPPAPPDPTTVAGRSAALPGRVRLTLP